jgi:hypothetical protein
MTQTELAMLASDGLSARLTGQWVHGKKYYFCRYLDIMTHGVGRKWQGKLAFVDLFSGPGRSIVRGSQEEVRQVRSKRAISRGTYCPSLRLKHKVGV